VNLGLRRIDVDTLRRTSTAVHPAPQDIPVVALTRVAAEDIAIAGLFTALLADPVSSPAYGLSAYRRFGEIPCR
jgi:hypothetical protein